MIDRRFNAHPAPGEGKARAVRLVRSYDGRVFAMSSDEARDLATQLNESADQADARRKNKEDA